jgi:hypothetical protein
LVFLRYLGTVLTLTLLFVAVLYVFATVLSMFFGMN